MSTETATDNIRFAVGGILISVLALSFGDALIKLVSIQFSLWQIYVVRSLLAIPMLLVVIYGTKTSISLIPKATGWTVIRSVMLAIMWVAYYTALPHIKLSVAAAVFYTTPLFITLYSGIFTGDRVSARAWLAVALGFTGVLIIVRPSTAGFNGYVLLPLISANLYALAMILTRTRCRQESPKILSLWLNIVFIATGLLATGMLAVTDVPAHTLQSYPFLVGPWSPLGLSQWLVIAVLAVIMILGSLFAALAYQNGPSSLVATFDYSYLGFSLMWGALIFSELPGGLSIAGIVMVAIAGLIAVRQ